MNDSVQCIGCGEEVDCDGYATPSSSEEDEGDAQQQQQWAYYCKFCYDYFCSSDCMDERMPTHAQRCHARDREAMQGISDPEELAVRFGVCSYQGCSNRADGDDPLPNGCIMCNKRLWCENQDCMLNGLQQHYQICTERRRRHAALQMRGEYTPRSAVARLWRNIELRPAIAARLYRACREGERAQKTPGVMVLAHDTIDAVCDLINTVRESEVELFKFVTLKQLMELGRDRLRPLWEARLLVGRGVRAVVLGVVYGVGADVVAALPRVVPISRDTKGAK